MIKGMTGFGSVQASMGKIKGVFEIKSQNHRYLDVVYYLPSGFGKLEEKIKAMITKEISRGRVNVSFKITEKPTTTLSFNKDVVAEYLKYAQKLKKEFHLDNNLSLSDLIRLPGVVETKDVQIDANKIWPSLEKNVKRAVTSLMAMRKREGKALSVALVDILKRMLVQIKKIQTRVDVILRDKKKKLTVEEFTSFQKSCDIQEELTRLAHYVEEFKLLLKSKVCVGKKLDFIAQEMQRETNTIGSKLQDKIVSQSVIALKGKIEKLREQAQNIE